MSPVGRRGFLGGVLAALTAVATPIGWVGRAVAGSTSGAATPAAKLARLFSDAAATQRIGRAYLVVAPDEDDAAVLRTALAPAGESPDEWWESVGVPELRRTMRAAAHADFAAGAVVDLEGWLLARTEARLAALFSLTR